MVGSREPHDPIQPLAVGDVVSTGLRLYRSHFNPYLGISARAVGWLLLFILVMLVLAVVLPSINPALVGLLVLVGIPLYIFCAAKFATNSALISRLAFGELVNQPEPVKVARDRVDPRLWQVFLVVFLMGLISLAVSIAFSVVGGILAAVIGGIARGGLAGAALINLIQLVALGVQLWINARLFTATVPVVVEEGIGGADAIGRSWTLSNGHSGRIVVVTLVTFLITLPLFVLMGVLGFTFLFPIVRNPVLAPSEIMGQVVLASFGIIALFLIGFMLLIPLWETVRAIVYYDLRSRREGMGLQLRDRS